MSYVFIIHKPDRSGFVLAADTRETLHGEVPHLAHTDKGEKLFFSSKHRFAIACFNGTTVRHVDAPDDDTQRLFMSYILKKCFDYLDKNLPDTAHFVDCVKGFWGFIKVAFPAYLDDIKKEVCFVFAGFDETGKSCTARYGHYFDTLEVGLTEGEKGKTLQMPNMIYAPLVGFPEQVVDEFYLDKIAPNRAVAEALTRKQRLELFIPWAFGQGKAAHLACHVGNQAFSNADFNPDGTIGSFFDCVEMSFADVKPSLVDGERHGCRTMTGFIDRAEKSIAEQKAVEAHVIFPGTSLEEEYGEIDDSALGHVLRGSSPS